MTLTDEDRTRIEEEERVRAEARVRAEEVARARLEKEKKAKEQYGVLGRLVMDSVQEWRERRSPPATSLVNCPECKREISKKALSCPGCGAPSPGQEAAQKVKVVGANVAVGVGRWVKFVVGYCIWGVILGIAWNNGLVGDTGLEILLCIVAAVLWIHNFYPNFFKTVK